MKAKRLIFPDLLRLLSMFFVVLIHVTSVGISEHEGDSYAWTANILLNSISRWAVPMFFMISGFFFLDPDKTFELKAFYRKNVARIVRAILIAGLLYSFLDQYLYGTISLKSIPMAFYAAVTDRSGYHLWFLYSLLMIYIATPVLRVFTANAEEMLLRYALICWGLFSVAVGQVNALAESFLHTERLLPYEAIVLTQYSGYYLLGFYLKKYPITVRSKKIMIFCLGTLSLLAMSWTTRFASLQVNGGKLFRAFQMPMGMGNVFVCIAVFTLVAPLETSLGGGKLKGIIEYAGNLTFYAYLLHVAFIYAFRNTVITLGNHYTSIILISVVFTVVSYIAAGILWIICGHVSTFK